MDALIDESKKHWEKKNHSYSLFASAKSLGKKENCYYKKVLLKGGEIGAGGAILQKVRFPKGLKINPHFHRKQTEIFYVSGGSAVIEINGRKYKADERKMFIVRPDDLHSIDNSKGKEDFEIVVFKVNEPEDENDFFE